METVTTTKTTTKLGAWLKEKIEAAGLTQLELSTKLGYASGQFVSNWTRGVSYPPAKAIPTLAETLGVDSNELAEKVVDGILTNLTTKTKTEYGV